MINYTHLSDEEKYTLCVLKKQGKTIREIAKTIGRSPSTISREIKRNSGKKGYRYRQAKELTKERQKKKHRFRKITPAAMLFIKERITVFDWSPEQISNKLKEFGFASLAPKTIYRLVHENKKAGGEWYKRLRICSKRYRKKYGKGYRREQIPDRVCISERPAVVDDKIRIGDWEADTVIGKGHQGAFVTLLERRSRLFLAERIPSKSVASVTAGLIKLLGQLKDFVHTITFDNGREFSGHLDVAKALGCETFFARPYHSWERGANENANGLLRQYFPKGMSLLGVTDNELDEAVRKMNDRHRKCVGFKSPKQVFLEIAPRTLTKSEAVALTR